MHISGFPLVFKRFTLLLLFRIFRLFVLLVQKLRWALDGTGRAVRESALPENYDRSVRAMHVIHKYRADELQTLTLEDFLLTHDCFLSPEYIFDNDHVTLMTINDDVAVFSEPLPGQQLWRSQYSGFLRFSQVIYSKRLLLVPLPAFHRMAEQLGDPKHPVIYQFNTARCGSTLLNQVMEYSGECVALSEPDVLNTLASWCRERGETKQVVEVTRDCLRWVCRPYTYIQPKIYFIKVPTTSIIAIRLFHQLSPTSKCMFMYRGIEKAAQSVIRLAQELPLVKCATAFGKLSGHFVELFINACGLYGKIYNIKLEDDIDFGMIIWLAAAREYMVFRNSGFSLEAVRYEDLVGENSRFAVEAILEFCELPKSLVDKAIKGLEFDSQRNSPVSAAILRRHKDPPLTERSKKKFGKMMIECGLPAIDSDGYLEATMTRFKSD